MARTEAEAWRSLLTNIKITAHSGWRTALVGLQRRVGMSSEVTELQEAFPEEKAAQIRACISPASQLGIDGHSSADKALNQIMSIHAKSDLDYDKLEMACRDLGAAMDLITAQTREHFSCSPKQILQRVLNQLKARQPEGVGVFLKPKDPSLSSMFPMHGDDLFLLLRRASEECIQESPRAQRGFCHPS